jgi:hypothetical protein
MSHNVQWSDLVGSGHPWFGQNHPQVDITYYIMILLGSRVFLGFFRVLRTDR